MSALERCPLKGGVDPKDRIEQNCAGRNRAEHSTNDIDRMIAVGLEGSSRR